MAGLFKKPHCRTSTLCRAAPQSFAARSRGFCRGLREFCRGPREFCRGLRVGITHAHIATMTKQVTRLVCPQLRLGADGPLDRALSALKPARRLLDPARPQPFTFGAIFPAKSFLRWMFCPQLNAFPLVDALLLVEHFIDFQS